MKNFTVPMALIDFIPVILFGIAAVYMQRGLYNKMSKGAFALFAAGTIDIVCAGLLKALYKLLYAAKVCDFEPLNSLFFPLQSLGFLLAGLGVIAMLTHKQTGTKLNSVAPVASSGTAIFVSAMVIGMALIYIGLSVISVKLKKPILIAVFVVSLVLMMGMGYLSTKDFSEAYMNWVAQGINILAQGLLLYGVIRLNKLGMTELVLK